MCDTTRRHFLGHLAVGGLALTPLAAMLSACGKSGWPEGMAEIKWDRDTCTRCRMAISDRRFAAQVRGGPKDQVFKFDDIGQHYGCPLVDPIVEFVSRFREDPTRARARMYRSCGVFESLIYYNRSLQPLLQAAGVDLRYEEAQDGHNWINWRDRQRSALSWLFPGHLWMMYE